MKTLTVQKFVKPGFPLIILTSIFFLISWSFNLFFRFDDVNFIELISIFAISVLNVFLISFINKKFTVIRTRTFHPALIYFIFITTWKRGFISIYPHIGLSVILLCLIILMGMYKERQAVIPALWINIFISAISINNPLYLIFIPVLWVGFIQMQSISLRVFLSSLMGLVLPWIYYLSYQFYKGNEIANFQALISEFKIGLWTNEMLPHELIYSGLICLIFIISLFNIYSNLYSDSLQTRKYINFFVFISAYLLITSFLFPSTIIVNLPIYAFLLSILMSHPFTLNKTKFTNILFLIFCGVNLIYLFYDIILLFLWRA